MRTHCKNGHELTSENSYWHKKNQNLRCRTCHKEYQKSLYRKKRGHLFGVGVVTHGCARSKNKSAEYRVWDCMKQRCYNRKNASYKYYGARGIGICERWKNSFDNFLFDMGLRPSSKHTIDRIRGYEDYCPENCRWATAKEQANNRRRPLKWIKQLEMQL